MKKTHQSLGLLTSSLLLLSLSACTTQRQIEQEKHQIFNNGNRTMKSILQGGGDSLPLRKSAPAYRQAPDWSKRSTPKPVYRETKYVPTGERNNEDYTRSEKRELAGLFPRLPNPDLCMYVFPHLTSEKATVPGYTSCFPMYETNQYALPGEMSALWQIR